MYKRGREGGFNAHDARTFWQNNATRAPPPTSSNIGQHLYIIQTGTVPEQGIWATLPTTHNNYSILTLIYWNLTPHCCNLDHTRSTLAGPVSDFRDFKNNTTLGYRIFRELLGRGWSVASFKHCLHSYRHPHTKSFHKCTYDCTTIDAEDEECPPIYR